MYAQNSFIFKYSGCSAKKTGIFSFVDHDVYNIFLLHTVHILVFYFDLLVFTQSAYVKVFLAWTFRCSRERSSDIASFVEHLPCSISQCIVSWYCDFYFGLSSWCTLCIAFWDYKVSWFLIAYFNSVATHIADEKIFLSGNVWCSTEKAAILLFSWSTLYISFSM